MTKKSKKRISYTMAKKKYTPEEIKTMYLLGEITLTTKEWKDNDKRVGRDYFGVNTKFSVRDRKKAKNEK